ncbi:MAG TPA: class I SAM-dependent methyltransferase, partial [Ktedonobacteraceae bacterium]|nr:class I SAM-dependent methyltransferase [Ktedonobacteraceae bacterium]
MEQFQDSDYLLHKQYKDATNFSARIELNRRFSVNKYGWQRWVFDHFKVAEPGMLIELGCGPGLLWAGNHERIPQSWQIILSDFSPGMLENARNRLGDEPFAYSVVDAQSLPFADESFDAVIANHMLYHIPDLPRALSEIRRVLKPGGRFYASTFGRTHMHEMDDLVRNAWPLSRWRGLGNSASFVLENGQELLAPFFPLINIFRYEDALEVTEAEPVANYVFSG